MIILLAAVFIRQAALRLILRMEMQEEHVSFRLDSQIVKLNVLNKIYTLHCIDMYVYICVCH